MFDFLKSSKWSSERVAVRANRTVERDSYRREAEDAIKAGDFAAAERHLLQAIQESDQAGAPRTERIQLRLELADVQHKKVLPELAADPESTVQAKREVLAVAERTVRAAIEIATASQDPHEFVVCMDALADLFADAQDFNALEKVEREALRLGAALPNPDIGLLAARTHRLGMAVHRLGRAEEAGKLLARSVELHEKRYGESSLEVAKILTDCGAVFRSQGDHDNAKRCLERAVRIHETTLGPDAPEIFEDVEKLARVLEESGDLAGTAYQYERALLIKIRKLGFGNLEEVAEMQYKLANLYIDWGNLARARELLEESVGEFRRHGGPRLAVALEVLAQVEERLGHFSIAVQELEKAGTAWEKCGPSRTTELIRNMDYRADLLDQLRRTRDAIWLRQRMAELQTAIAAQA